MVNTKSRNDSYCKLWKVKMLLVLSHRTSYSGVTLQYKQAGIETDNITEESLVAKRTTCEYDNYVGGIQHVEVTNKKLTLAATTVHQSE